MNNPPHTAQTALREQITARAFVRASKDQRIINVGTSVPREVSWIYDFRAVVLDPLWLDIYAEIFWERFSHRFPFQVGGMETAAIPLVSAIVMKGVSRGSPINGFYIRKSRDRDGLMKQIEGTLSDAPIILVDDLINSGSSFNKQIMVLENAGKKVSDIFTILAFRAQDAYEFAHRRGIQTSSLFTLADFGMPLLASRAPEMPAESFEVVWKFSAGNPSFEHVIQKSAPVIDEKNVYFGTDKGTFYALRQSDGGVVWSFDIAKHPSGKGIFSSPALFNGMLYFGAYDGNVYALDAATGAVRWTYEGADWIGSSPCVAENLGLVYAGLEFGLWKKRGGIAALDIKTGKERWRDTHPSLTHASPLYVRDENLVIIGSNDGVCYAYDATNGERRWIFQTGADIKTRPAYDPAHRLVFVPSMDSKLYALSARDGTPRWAFQTGAGIYSNPLVHDGVVYCASLDKSLYKIDFDGKKQAEFETNGRIFASPVIADNALWIGSNDGRLYELDPLTLKLKRFHQFTERIVGAVCISTATKYIFTTTVANELYALKHSQQESREL